VVTQSVMMTTQTDFRKRMEQRDRFMADNVRRTLDHDPKAKIILWAHIVHAAREKPWMGSHLEEMLPGQMKVLGVWVGQGECLIRIKNTSQTGPHRLKPVHPGSLESFFGAIGQPVFIVDLKRAVPGSAESGWLAQERPIRVVDWEGNEMHDAAMIPKVCDAIVYVDRGTPALPLKVAARAK
jgi:erythromycin esterase-like protein